jgi:hypothetical protein
VCGRFGLQTSVVIDLPLRKSWLWSWEPTRFAGGTGVLVIDGPCGNDSSLATEGRLFLVTAAHVHDRIRRADSDQKSQYTARADLKKIQWHSDATADIAVGVVPRDALDSIQRRTR